MQAAAGRAPAIQGYPTLGRMQRYDINGCPVKSLSRRRPVSVLGLILARAPFRYAATAHLVVDSLALVDFLMWVSDLGLALRVCP
eukprot:2308960-Prymnesium_polylepis.1